MKKLVRFTKQCFLLVILMTMSFKGIAQPSVSMLQPNEPNISWQHGSSYLISWVSNFTKPVNLELYKNNVFHSLIATSVVGSTYSWTISNPLILPGNDYKIRVISSVNPLYFAESTNNFAILLSLPSAFIHVEQPNLPGINYVKGTTNILSWSGQLSGNVSIELISTVPFVIASDNASNGNYPGGIWTSGSNGGSGFGPWLISSGTDGIAGVADAFIGDPAVSGLSGLANPSFGLVAYSNPQNAVNFVTAARTLSSPLSIGSTFSIDWGIKWANGIDPTPGEKGFKLFAVGGAQIVDIKMVNSSVITFNGAPMFNNLGDNRMTLNFMYLSANTLRVYGNGRDNVELFDQTISISAAPASFEFYSNGQSDDNWFNRTVYFNNLRVTTPKKMIATNVGNSTYAWNITPDFPLGNGIFKVKIFNVADTSLQDFSDNFFSISATNNQPLELFQPNSITPITWLKGSSYLISWNGNSTFPVRIDLYKTGVFHAPIATGVVGTTYAWTVGGGFVDAGDYRIRVTRLLDGAFVQGLPFSIQASPSDGVITVLQPNDAGITWFRENTHLISWSDNIPETVNIYLQKGVNPPALIASNVSGSTYYWPITALNVPVVGNDFKIIITSSLTPSLTSLVSLPFSIYDYPTNSAISILQPNVGGIKINSGTSYLISWTGSNATPVKIELIDGVTNLGVLPGNAGAASAVGSTFVWNIPAFPASANGNNYRIRITKLGLPVVVSESIPFEITNSLGGTIEVLQPNGGEILGIGSQYLISWIDNVTENVKIDLIDATSVYPYTVVTPIAGSVVGSTFIWNISSPTFVSGNYRILVSSTLNPAINDISNAPFSLITPPTFVVYPNPANRLVTVRFDDNAKGTYLLQLSDKFNMKMMTSTLDSGFNKETQIATAHLPNGVYFLTVSSEHTKSTQKIIVQH